MTDHTVNPAGAPVEGEPSWLDRMHNLLQWSVVYPQADNPFQEPIPTDKLTELANSKQALLKKVGLRCLLDGIEIVTIKNLSRFTMTTDHPQLTKLKKGECQRYLKRCGVVEMIEKELERIQMGYHEVLEQRAKEKRRR